MEHVRLRRHIRILPGRSQSILAEASDGFIYVVKLTNPKQRNLLFNESIGSELYRACGLKVPAWRPIIVSDDFLDQNPACWRACFDGIRPSSGVGFASLFVGSSRGVFTEILSGSALGRVRNRESFWLAWLVDACAFHDDHRQAVFLEDGLRGYDALFIDHGHLFGGMTGAERPHVVTSRYLDFRIYPDPTSGMIRRLRQKLQDLDLKWLYARAMSIPEEWRTKSALDAFSHCLERLRRSVTWDDVLSQMLRNQRQCRSRENGPYGIDTFSQSRLSPAPLRFLQ